MSDALGSPMDCSPPGSSIHGILQARILEWLVIPLSRGSSQSRDWTRVSCIVGKFFTIWATREVFGYIIRGYLISSSVKTIATIFFFLWIAANDLLFLWPCINHLIQELLSHVLYTFIILRLFHSCQIKLSSWIHTHTHTHTRTHTHTVDTIFLQQRWVY